MGKSFLRYFSFVIFIFALGFVILSSNNKKIVMTSNINSVKSLQAVHIVNKYNSIKEMEKKKETPLYDSFYDAISVASTSPVAFMGTLTAYGPDCPGCSGNSALVIVLVLQGKTLKMAIYILKIKLLVKLE